MGQVEQESSIEQMQEDPSGTRHGKLPDDKSNVEQKKNIRVRSSVSMEILQGENTVGDNYKSQKRDKERQSTKKFRISNLCGTNETHERGIREKPTNLQPKRRTESKRQIDNPRRAPNKKAQESRPEISTDSNSIWSGHSNSVPNSTRRKVGISQIIIGANSTRGAKKPPKEWADILIDYARNTNTAVWMKDNYGYPERIKEWPKCK